jgi:hypothetical protein
MLKLKEIQKKEKKNVWHYFFDGNYYDYLGYNSITVAAQTLTLSSLLSHDLII